MEFKDKIVLVTGSSSGIGAATAIQFGLQGAKVIINYLNNKAGAENTLKQISENGGNATIIKADVSNESEAKYLIEESLKYFGDLDILINNAGKYFEGDEWNKSSIAWQKTIQTNLFSTLNCSKYAGEHFLNNKSGVIVNIASRIGILGDPESISYGAAKAGIINVTKSYAKIMAPYVRVNCVSPGAINTGYWLTDEGKKYIKKEEDSIPLGRMLEVEDVVNTIIFLSSNKSKMITGQNLIVDGGYSLK